MTLKTCEILNVRETTPILGFASHLVSSGAAPSGVVESAEVGGACGGS